LDLPDASASISGISHVCYVSPIGDSIKVKIKPRITEGEGNIYYMMGSKD